MTGVLPFQPHDDDGPVFAEPWEAQVFALAVRLAEVGQFTWQEWTAALADEIARAQAASDPDLGNTYYHHWLRALERLMAEKRVLSPDMVDARADAWRRAYLATPHGQPVELSAGLRES